MYNDDTLAFENGKYKRKTLGEVPSYYLVNIYDHRSSKDEDLLRYIERKYFDKITRPIFWNTAKDEIIFVCDKVPYATREIARIKLKKIREKDQDHKKPIRVYECEKCSQWHLTSMPIEVFKSKK